jgi:hypothetical protein
VVVEAAERYQHTYNIDIDYGYKRARINNLNKKQRGDEEEKVQGKSRSREVGSRRCRIQQALR